MRDNIREYALGFGAAVSWAVEVGVPWTLGLLAVCGVLSLAVPYC